MNIFIPYSKSDRFTYKVIKNSINKRKNKQKIKHLILKANSN